MRNFLNNIISKVSGNEFKVLHVIYEDVNSSAKECILTNEQLAKATGMSDATIDRCLAKLDESGILTRDTDKAVLGTKGIKHESNPRTIKLTGVETKKEDTTQFDNFWKTVIKKADTKMARKRFMALNMEDREQVIETYAYYQEFRMNQFNNDKTKIKSLAAFINQENYKDEDWNQKTKRNFGQNIEYYTDMCNDLYFRLHGKNDGEKIRNVVTNLVRKNDFKELERQIKIMKERLAQSK